MKGVGLDVISEDFVGTLGKEAMVNSTLAECVRDARFAQKTEAVPPEATDGGYGSVDEATLVTFGEYPFFSV
jgi:hypothetical protein